MSDFIYSKNKMPKGKLTKDLQSIYQLDHPDIQEYHGRWGSLGVSKNLYNGFQIFEDDTHICAVAGGPVLCFRDNLFLTKGPDDAGTKAVLQRWLEKKINWDEDLNGPFAILIINKRTAVITCVTDLMSFIPVFAYQHSKELMISTHVDVLGIVSNQQNATDVVAKVDFILHGIITYPYTAYQKIYQLQPATVHFTRNDSGHLSSKSYWTPVETLTYTSIKGAASDLRVSMEDYVSRITEGMPVVGQFISGGEDSRAISGLLSKDLKRDAFIFLNSINREGRRAEKAAKAYGANFKLSTRSNSYYMDILPSSADLVGTGAEYVHAHTLKLYKGCRLNDYSAVFGGLYSDDILKGDCIVKILEKSRLPFIPQVKSRYHSRGNKITISLFKKEVLEELTRRRTVHLNLIKNFREYSADEWFELWPSSMNFSLATVHANRRLFRSYEPFMSNGVVKVSAAVPQRWRLNRRLFLETTKPYLKRTKWLFHSDGRLPYFPWYINSFIQLGVWSIQQANTRLGLVKGFQGPWGEWKVIMESREFQEYVDRFANGIKLMADTMVEKNVHTIFKSKELTISQRVNFLQILYINQKESKAGKGTVQRESGSSSIDRFSLNNNKSI
ncbi:hypothetical protein [Planococcus sp. CAU13]|uniref:hypothetical protein n=1 Tax=Planococcus sp. CAU13 TaxID=1541197 RepID=UPI000689A392|nr:hypothetical protein [Planococcus sp. CAU13]